MDDYYVYGYSDPTSYEPYFYIGKGRGNRVRQHFRPCNLEKETFLYNKLNKIIESGIEPEVTILDENLTEEQALLLEMYFISVYGRRNNKTGCLCNLTDGGEGVSGMKHSEETKEKIRQSCLINCRGTNTAYWSWKGQRHTTDTRIKMSEARSRETKQQKDKRKKLQRLKSGNPICSFNLVTKQIMIIYLSIRQVAERGYSRTEVKRVLDGSQPYYLGYGWRYLTKLEIKELI